MIEGIVVLAAVAVLAEWRARLRDIDAALNPKRLPPAPREPLRTEGPFR